MAGWWERRVEKERGTRSLLTPRFGWWLLKVFAPLSALLVVFFAGVAAMYGWQMSEATKPLEAAKLYCEMWGAMLHASLMLGCCGAMITCGLEAREENYRSSPKFSTNLKWRYACYFILLATFIGQGIVGFSSSKVKRMEKAMKKELEKHPQSQK